MDERQELEQLRRERAARPATLGPPPPINAAGLPAIARALGLDMLVTAAAWQNQALVALLAAPRTWGNEIMASLSDLATVVSRVQGDVTAVKTAIDSAVSQLQNVGNLTPDQQSQVDAAVSQLSTAADTLETESTALGAASQPQNPAPTPPTPPTSGGTAPQARR